MILIKKHLAKKKKKKKKKTKKKKNKTPSKMLSLRLRTTLSLTTRVASRFLCAPPTSDGGNGDAPKTRGPGKGKGKGRGKGRGKVEAAAPRLAEISAAADANAGAVAGVGGEADAAAEAAPAAVVADPFAVPWVSNHDHSKLTAADIGRVLRVGRHSQVATLKDELTVARGLFPEGHPAMEIGARIHFSEARRAGEGVSGGGGDAGGGGGGGARGGARLRTAQWHREEYAGPETEYLPVINHDNPDGPSRIYPPSGPGSIGGEPVPLWVQGLAQIPDTYIGVLVRPDMVKLAERLDTLIDEAPQRHEQQREQQQEQQPGDAAAARSAVPNAAASSASTTTHGVLITGEKGRGKSTTLAYAVGHARERGWLTLYNRVTHDWTHTQAFVPPCPVSAGLFRLPAVEFDLIDSLRDAQTELLASLPARSDHARDAGDKTLLEVASRALADLDAEDYPECIERSSRSVAAFFAELRLCVDAPVLIAIDEFASLYDTTEYTIGTGLRQIPAHGKRRIEATELTVVHHLERTIKGMARGTFAAALSSGPIPRGRAKFRTDKDRGFPLERLEVDTTAREAVALAHMWHHQGQLSLRPTDDDLTAIYSIGGRNLHIFKDGINRRVAQALEDDIPNVFNLERPEMRRWFGGVHHE
jgi:hypothetical protein